MHRILRTIAVACAAIMVLVAFQTLTERGFQLGAKGGVGTTSVTPTWADSDGDGLTDAYETSTVYFQDVRPGSLPIAIDDKGSVNGTALSTSLSAFYGPPVKGLANFTIDHAAPNDLTAAIGYWNGTAWIDRFVWDPGRHASKVSITSPANGAFVSGTVAIVANVQLPELTQYVEFRVNGALRATVYTPQGHNYIWSWPTPPTVGDYALNATQVELLGAKAYSQITVRIDLAKPTAVWVAPANASTVGKAVSLTVNATDDYGIDSVEYWLGTTPTDFVGISRTPQPGTTNYVATWNTCAWDNGTYRVWGLANDKSGKVTKRWIGLTVSRTCPEPPPPPDPCQRRNPPCIAEAMFVGKPAPGSSAPPPRPEDVPTATLGILQTEWREGKTTAGTRTTIVVNLTAPRSGAPAGNAASRIIRPEFNVSLFSTNLLWRLVVRDWTPGTAGSITSFILRYEAKSDATKSDTDGDTMPDGTEVNTWHILPVCRDSDVDGLSDNYEITPHTLTLWADGSSSILPAFRTNPAAWDSDGDGLSDGQERGFVTTAQSKVIGEVGLVKNLGSTWTTVFLRNRYTTPIVIAEPTTFRDHAASHVRVQGVGVDHTFQLKVEKWVAGGSGALEDVAYLVVEAGNHVLSDGTVVEAGFKTGVGSNSVTVTFQEAFSLTPLILVQTETVADAAAVIAKRTVAVSASSFGVYLNANSSTSHGAETVGYIAISPQTDPNTLATWTRAEVSFTQKTGTWNYPAKFAVAPLVLAWMKNESAGGNKNIGVRLSSVTNASASIYREQSGTAPADWIGFFAFAGKMNVTARMTTNPNATDTDGDNLSDGIEVNTYGSNPTLKDSDADGIPDNVEVASRTITIPVNGTPKTITFRTSPTSDDTDADGVKDAEELAGVLDHRLLFYDMSTLADAGHVRDFSGNGVVGTLYGPTNATTNRIKVGNALDFRGVSDKVVSVIPGMSRQSSWSFSLWMQWDNGVTTSYQHLIALGTGHDVTLYVSKNPLFLALKVTDASGNAVVDNAIASFDSTTATQPHQVAVTFDGVNLRAYVDGVAKGPWAAASLKIRTDSLKLGTSGFESGNFFDGRIDEVQVWDRALAGSEVTGYYNTTNAAASIVASLDMDSRTSANDLFDFGGNGHPGVVTGTTVVDGRSGFARSFSGSSDGILLSGTTGSTLFSAGAALSLYVLASSFPSVDTPIASRKGAFYLNLTSDGRAVWTVVGKGSIATPLPVALNRCVRITATANSAGSALYLDGVSAASSTTNSVPASQATSVVLGYAEGVVPRFTGSLDEVLVLNTVPTAWTIADLAVRGIQLNPNATDTDADGLSDGREQSMVTFRTPKRFPLPQDSSSNIWDAGISTVAGPAWSVRGLQLIVGITHPNMGQVQGTFGHLYVIPTFPYLVIDRLWNFRLGGSNAGQVNNFTSYDLLQKPPTSDSTWLLPSDLKTLFGAWFVAGHDDSPDGLRGQLEYAQLQVTMRTFPNRADTDGDGLNDSEEVNLGSDGYQTDPWNPDTDGDTLLDTEYSTKGTSPVLADTDRDGARDDKDLVPLGDAFVEVRVDSTYVAGSDSHNSGSVPLPFVKITIQGNTTYTPHLDGRTGTWYTWDYVTLLSYVGHRLSVNIPDDLTSLTVSVEMWSFDSRAGTNQHTQIIAGSHTEKVGNVYICVDDPTVSLWYNVGSPGTPSTYVSKACSGSGLRANPLNITITTIVPNRVTTDLIVPSDYAGIYNVTNPSGGLVGRRYTGEPRFVGILLNATTWDNAFHCYCGPPVPMSMLLPRSVFFETELYKKLNATNPTSPLDKLVFRQNDTTASSNSDGVQQVLTGNVTMWDWVLILNLLLYNATNVQVRTAIRLSNDLLLYSFPTDVVHFVAYTPPLTAPSSTYTFCSGSCGSPTQRPWWELVWMGVISVITSVVQSAIIVAITAFARLVQILAQIGSWLWATLSGAARAVKEAVEAAGKALLSLFDWIAQWFADMIRGVVQFIVSTVETDMRQLVQLVRSLGSGPLIPGKATPIALLPLGTFLWGVKQKVEDTFTVAEAAESTISAVLMATGVGGPLKVLISKITVEAVKKALQRVVLAMTVGVIVQNIAALANQSAVAAFFGQVFGIPTGIAASALAMIEIFEKVFDKKPGAPRSKYAIGVGWAVLGLAIELLAIPILDATMGTAKGLPLVILDVLAGTTALIGLLIMGGKKIFKTGVLSVVIDKLVEFLGPITSGTEQLLTAVSATSTFASIAVHATSGDYFK